MKPLFAPEVIVGFGLLEGRPVGIVASNSMHKGGALFVDSADKAARFIWCCDAFGIPLVFLADVPGFMVGHRGRTPGHHPPRRQDDHRGVGGDGPEGVGDRAQGLRRRAVRVRRDRRSRPTRAIALPTARIAVMGPEAAINAVYANKIAAIDDPEERAAFVDERRAEFAADVDLLRLASELVIDAIVEPEDLRADLVARLALAGGKDRTFSDRLHGVPPV